MTLTITTLCTAIFALIVIPLSFQVTLRRIALGNVAVGDGEDLDLTLKRETLRNFVEYVPLGLILLAVYENIFGSVTSTMVFCGMFVFSRVLHIFGFQFMKSPKYFAPAMVIQHTYFSLVPIILLYEIINGN